MTWRVELFGRLAATQGEVALTHFETRKTAALLALLALQPQKAHPRDELAEQLWPEEDWEETRNRLRQALAALRREVEFHGERPDSVLIADRSEVRLAPGAIVTDVAEFEEATRLSNRLAKTPSERVELLQNAVSLYRGQLLPGFYEDLIASERHRLQETYIDALGRLATACSETGDVEQGIHYARLALSEDPLREQSCCRLMRLYAAAGRVSDAIRQYSETEMKLREELDVTPSESTRRLAERLRSEGVVPVRTGAEEDAPSRQVGEETDAAIRPALRLDPIGGAVPLDSPFYIERDTDSHFLHAISRSDSIVLVKGARQIGKTSLLARGLQAARKSDRQVILTDLQKFEPEHLENLDSFFLAMAEMIADQLDLDISPETGWMPHRGGNANFERFMRREVLGRSDRQITWGLDEVDRLFSCPFGGQVFALFRSWHNERSLDPAGPWGQLTIAIAYATEAHLFISDLNQSPFNVGTRLELDDFTREQVHELDRRYGHPLRSPAEADRLWDLMGGHPYLVRRCLHVLTSHGVRFPELMAEADREDGLFGDHLGRTLLLLGQCPDLAEAVRAVLLGQSCPSRESFYRLRSAGVLKGDDAANARPRCGLYARHLTRRLL